MKNRDIRLQEILSGRLMSETDFKIFALESFAKDIDHLKQKELLTKLILEHSSVARRLEDMNTELVRSRELLDEAHKIAKIGRWDIDVAAGKVIWSDSMYDILEIDKTTEASTELFFSLVHPNDLDKVKSMYKDMFIEQKPWTTRYRLLLRSGELKWVNLEFHGVFDDQGNAIQLYGTIQDITKMKSIEDELERYNQHLEELVEEKIQEISSSQMSTIYALVKLSESRDDDTGDHIKRTASFCKLLAQKAKSIPEYTDLVTDSFIETIYKASPLHDIGKVGIPDNILLKPGKLTDEEFTIMKTHVQIGYDTLSKIGHQYDKNEFLRMGMEISLYHHEKWNGSGYTKGLKGTEIPLSARIMAISDVYDALRSKRVYKEAFSHEKSMDIITSSSGSHFDPYLIDVFIKTQEEFRSLYDSFFD